MSKTSAYDVAEEGREWRRLKALVDWNFNVSKHILERDKIGCSLLSLQLAWLFFVLAAADNCHASKLLLSPFGEAEDY